MTEKKLRPKYNVQRIDEEGDVIGALMKSTDPDNADSPFVLMPRKDPAALYALLNYSQMCEPDLAKEIIEWAEKIVEAFPVYGTQGERNRLHAKLKQIRLYS